MLQKVADVIGLPVICKNKNNIYGKINDVVFEEKHMKIEGFVILKDDYASGRRFLKFEDISDCGEEAIIIDSEDQLQPLPAKCKRKKDLDESFKKRVFTKRGEEVGFVKDMIFNSYTGKIECIQVSEGLISDILNGTTIIPLLNKTEFSEEIIVINHECMEESYKRGGIRRYWKA